jgi:L-ascorbate metabolism protein UlaG (beta-lactamase superfamily)
MIITYHDQLHVKLQTGDTVISINPVGKDSGKKTTRYGADLCLVSTNLPLTNGVDQVTFSGKTPFVIDGAGEYEAGGITVRGICSSFEFDGQQKINTAYTFSFDGIKVGVLGLLQGKITPEIRDGLGACDILFVPVLDGEKFSYMNPHDAHAAAVALEAKVIIPIGHNDKTLPIFLKEAGATNVSPLEKLTIKKKEVDSKDGEVVTLQAI